jgi:hypothetical protein
VVLAGSALRTCSIKRPTMLARRPRKPRDDEPLVPHGLVSQALDATPPVVETTSQPPPKPAGSETIAYPTRPVPAIANPPRAKSCLSPAQPLSTELQQLRSDVSARVTRIRGFFITRVKTVRDVFAKVLTKVQLVPDSLSGVGNRIGNKCKISSAHMREFTSTRTREGFELTRNWKSKGSIRLHGLTIASIQRLKEARTKVHFPEIGAASNRRIRIRFAGAPLQARLAFTRARLEWSLWRESVSRNSRLWTSLALGALAALLVMGIFSTARHYVQASLPSRSQKLVSVQENTPVAQTTVSKPTTDVLKRSSLAQPVNSTSTSVTKPKAVWPKDPGKPAVVRKRIQRHQDEDYVAEDTYVYYGKKASRQEGLRNPH